MKRNAGILNWVFIPVLLGAVGCSTLRISDSAALQGTWDGREMRATPDTPRRLVFSGNEFDYRGAHPDDWGKGTFALREETQPKQLLLTLKECGPAQYIGKTCWMIYKIEDGTLSIAGNEPGNPTPPSSFEDGARHMVFRKNQESVVHPRVMNKTIGRLIGNDVTVTLRSTIQPPVTGKLTECDPLFLVVEQEKGAVVIPLTSVLHLSAAPVSDGKR